MRALAILLFSFSLAATSSSAQTTWDTLNFGQSRDSVHAYLDNQNLAVSSTPDNNLQTNSDYPILIPGLLYPIPVMVTFQFDANSHLAEITLALDLPAMRHDWAAIGPDEALYTFASDKLAFALAGQYGAPTFSSSTCNAATEATPCTLQWHGSTNQSIQLERIPTGRHLRIHYLPQAPTL
jgi:hypothetical protein